MVTLCSSERRRASSDTQAATETTRTELSSKYRWSFLGEEGRRINAVLAGVESKNQLAQFKAWERYLQKTLKFPFEAEVTEFLARGQLHVGDIVKILRMELVDDSYGIIVHCKRYQRLLDAPLADLECTDLQSVNYEPLKDYAVWFANR